MAIKFGRPIERTSMERTTSLAPVKTAASTDKLDLTVRPRRNRRAEWSRRMVRENVLTTDDLIWPLFWSTAPRCAHRWIPCPASTGFRSTKRCARPNARAKLGIPCLALFPYTEPGRRGDDGSEALNPDNLVCHTIGATKKRCRRSACSADVALDPYTSHGHDGLIHDGMSQRRDGRGAGRAGAGPGQGGRRHHRAVGHDGRPGRRDPHRPRAAGFDNVQIMSYAAKYACAFYGPFRDAVGSDGL